MADFNYNRDIGTPSYNAIAAFAHRSGVPFQVTSSYRPGDPGYHGKGNAVDMASSSANMAALAQWLYQYAPYELELIHSGGAGYFVKNGKKVTASFYGPATVSEHYNHVHCAMTLSGLNAAGTGAAPGNVTGGMLPVSTSPMKFGCLPLIACIGSLACLTTAVMSHWV